MCGVATAIFSRAAFDRSVILSLSFRWQTLEKKLISMVVVRSKHTISSFADCGAHLLALFMFHLRVSESRGTPCGKRWCYLFGPELQTVFVHMHT